MKMFRLCFLIFLSSALSNLSEARHENKNPSAVAVGSVYCDTCSQLNFSKASHFISGAIVAVECSLSNTTLNFTKEVSTNKHGKFKVHLPFSVNKHVKKIDICSVKLIKSSEPSCAMASTSTSSSLNLKSRKEGKHIFSAGFFTFKPLNKPEHCNQKPSFQELKTFESQNSIPNLDDEKYLPPLPELPHLPSLPQLPPLPFLPGIPFLPQWPQAPFLPLWPPMPQMPPMPPTIKGTTKISEALNQNVDETQFFGPNPFPGSLFPPIIRSPPISMFPPITPSPPFSLFPPTTPSPPFSLFPPITPSPPFSLFPPIIPFPSTPPPSLIPPVNDPPAMPDLSSFPLPPPPPVFRFPLPSFPFQPMTGIPGAPWAVTTSVSSRNSLP